MATREEQIDKLTREKIGKEMNVPSEMVSKNTDLYKKTYSEMEKKVPLDYVPSPNQNKPKSNPEKTIFNKPNFYKKPAKPVYNPNSDDGEDDDDIDELPLNKSDISDDVDDINISTAKKNIRNVKNVKNFNVKGKQKPRKLHWLDLPTSDELEKYSKCNTVCKNLVKMYTKRYKEVENQLLELQEIVNDIDKYSNYDN